MAIIGTFTKQENGSYIGTIRTLSFTASVSIEPVANKNGERSPDYRVHCQSSGPGEIGAAWNKTSPETSAQYLSLKLDDPTFTAPIHCRLVYSSVESVHSLIWERKRD